MRLTLLALVACVSFSSFAFAETATVTVDGMHCTACKKMVQQNVCNDKEISAGLESCKVEMNSKTKVGTVTMVSKDKSAIDMKKVEAAIANSGDEFKITKKEVK